jgi:hypothetical protein
MLDELFAAAVTGDEEAVKRLQLDDRDAVYLRAGSLCLSAVMEERATGLVVLSQWSSRAPRFVEERVVLGIRGLGDPEIEVVRAGAWVLSHLAGWSDLAVKELVGLGDSADVEVRLAVAHGLAWRMEGVETLVLLTRDVDDTVRDWATFGLGEMAEADSEKVRGALRARLGDSFEAVRLEAIWGLARRRDAEGLAILRARLAGDEWVSGDRDVAEDLGLLD